LVSFSSERSLKLHAAIWEHYGLQFFELFDLRRAEEWKAYIQFLTEYYELMYQERRAMSKQRGVEWQPSEPLGYQVC
jgi:hypothetical protein